MEVEIKKIGITEGKQATWGRVFVDYCEKGENKFAFRNWLKFEELNYLGEGSFEDEAAYTWFDSKKVTNNVESVIEGEYDYLSLTSSKYKEQYGTPSKILESLLNDIENGLVDDVKNRRGVTG